jgi:methyl-accepting chemotaxis protein PixJ
LTSRLSRKGTSETQSLALTFNELVLRVKGFLGEQTLNARKATLFAEITGTSIVSSMELGQLFDQVVEEARDILNTDRVLVYQFGAEGRGLIAGESAIEVCWEPMPRKFAPFPYRRRPEPAG